jgi:hypothetical protein
MSEKAAATYKHAIGNIERKPASLVSARMRAKLKSLIIGTDFVDKEKWPYPRVIDRYGTYLFAAYVSACCTGAI